MSEPNRYIYLAVGECHGLAVSIEACHSKGRRFETAPRLFFFSGTFLEQTRVKKCGSKGTGGPSSREERWEGRREAAMSRLERGTKQHDEGRWFGRKKKSD